MVITILYMWRNLLNIIIGYGLWLNVYAIINIIKRFVFVLFQNHMPRPVSRVTDEEPHKDANTTIGSAQDIYS